MDKLNNIFPTCTNLGHLQIRYIQFPREWPHLLQLQLSWGHLLYKVNGEFFTSYGQYTAESLSDRIMLRQGLVWLMPSIYSFQSSSALSLWGERQQLRAASAAIHFCQSVDLCPRLPQSISLKNKQTGPRSVTDFLPKSVTGIRKDGALILLRLCGSTLRHWRRHCGGPPPLHRDFKVLSSFSLQLSKH